jgi:hypothetical protein
MADDSPPSPPPQRLFSAKNEQKGVLIDDGTVEIYDALRRPDDDTFNFRYRSSDNEMLFIQCMPDAARRRIAFNVVERNCREAFARGKAGVALFLKVRDLVELAEVEEAINEFDKRFELWRLVREGVVPDGIVLRPAQ